MKLVIAEKPSVAQSIARVIGASSRRDGYMEGPRRSGGPAPRADRSGAETGYLVSWCLGHLVEPAEPEHYDEKYGKWKYEDLPILPETWDYRVSPGTKKQFEILKGLMKRDDVDSLICATDAGREGELIFRLVYQQAGCKKHFERLWISSMEDTAIREGFRNLKPGSDYDNLYEAALCRERADWIVGMNATRLFSCLYGTTLNVGRVMTPILGMTVMREAEIRAFRPETFYEIELKLSGSVPDGGSAVPDHGAGSTAGSESGSLTARGGRIKDKNEAEEVRKACQAEGHAVVLSSERKEKTEKPPLLYDLTSLQRDDNRLLGFTAQQTLDYTQSLYEKKLVTYPRTDSRYLTEDMEPVLPEWLAGTAGAFGVPDFHPDSGGGEQKERISRMIDSSKVSDHHAIIPTKTCANADLSGLPSGEMQVLMLIACRFLAAAGGPHRYAETSVRLLCGNTEFHMKGREELSPGWRETEQHFRQDGKEKKDLQTLPSLEKGQILKLEDAQMKEGKTTSPKRFTEDTLLSCMESAGAKDRADSPEGAGKESPACIPDEAERRGLGTPATRAGIIEKLVQKGFAERRGDKKTKYLVPTDKGISLITVMPEMIRSPAMTADWEQKLLQIERGEYDPAAFMKEIGEMISTLVKTYEAVKGADVLMEKKKVIGTCPHCGAEVIERQKGWFCSSRDCRFVLWKDNGYFTKIGKHLTGQMAEKLLRDGRIRLKDCKSRRTGKTYTADLLLSAEDDGRAVFSMEFPAGKGGARGDKDHDHRG